MEIVEPQVPLVQNGSMQLKIVAHRKEGFNESINVELPFRPPGVGAANSMTIPNDQNEVLYPLNANDKAGVKKWKIVALGSANVNGTAWVASQPSILEIAPPYVTFEVQRAACEQGQDAQIYCKISHSTSFDGKAKVQLLGLPPKVTTAEFLEIDKDTAELTFDLKTVADSPVGKHNNLFCQLTIIQNDEPIVSRAGGTQLQIDKPLPAPAGEPEKPEPQPEEAAKPAEPEKTKAKPLSRLEKLRLAAKQRAEARAAQLKETQNSG